MRNITFESAAFKEFIEFSKSDKKIFEKIAKMILEIRTNPFEGLHKPEPLKHNLHSYWSRRINDEHRLVYKITESEVIIISCKYHY
jgi:toxin YoeB